MAKKPKRLIDAEATAILSELPVSQDGWDMVPNAYVYISDTGRLCIEPIFGGWLGIKKEDLGRVMGDLAPYSD